MKLISSNQLDRIKKIIDESIDGTYYGEYSTQDDYQIAYQTSKLRENLINWYDFDSNAEMLVIENGCGALIPFFSKKVLKVDVLQNNSSLNKIISMRCNNIKLIDRCLEEFDTEKRYKYIFVDDDFENIHQYGFTLENYIQRLMSLLTSDGILLVATGNRLALRNLNGWFENKKLFSQIKNDIEDECIFYTKAEFESVLEKLDINNYKFYYPFPYKDFPRTVFTDGSNNFMDFGHHYNSIGDNRYKFFDERRMYNELQDKNIVDAFSNAFLIEIGKDKAQLCKTIFAKNQYYIGKQYKVVTKIYGTENDYYAKKIPLTNEARNHLYEFYKDSLKMKNTKHFNYIKYDLEKDGSLHMPFIKGNSLSKILANKLNSYLHNIYNSKSMLLNELKKEFSNLYSAMKEDAILCNPSKIFNDEFKQYYGNEIIDKQLLCFETSTLDLHLDHIYKRVNNVYDVIDLDPVALFYVPIDYLMWSVIESWIYTYVKNNKTAEKVISTDIICNMIGLDISNIGIFNTWKRNHFLDNDGKSQLVPFYSKEYLPKFINYSSLGENGIEKNSNDRRSDFGKKYSYFEMTSNSNFIIYGASAIGGAVKTILNYYNYGHILGFIDKRYNEISTAHGLPVWSIKDAPKEEGIIVYIGIKNVFDQEEIAKQLVDYGYTNIIFMPKAIIRGDDNEQMKKISDVYNFIIDLKGKDLSKFSFYDKELIPKTTEFEKIELKDSAIISNQDNKYIVNMPIQYLFTAQQHINPTYPWAEQSIISLVPHTLLYNYLWNGGKDNTNLYVNFCAYGARGSGVKMTEGWKKNLVENRLTVLSAMKRSLEEDADFFIRNAPEALYNEEYNYFNLNGGRHRAALFVFENYYKMPVMIDKDSYNKFINKEVVKEIEQYLNNNDIKLENPVSHPYFYDLDSKRPQYYQIVIKKIIEYLSKESLEKYDYIDFKKHSFGIISHDHGELKRMLNVCHFGIKQINEITVFDMLLDKLFKIQNHKLINNYDYLFIDETINDVASSYEKIDYSNEFKKVFILKVHNQDMIISKYIDITKYKENIITSSFFNEAHVDILCLEKE